MVLEPIQPGEVARTCAGIDASTQDLNYHSRTSLDDGIPRFTDRFKAYRGVA